MRLAPVAQRYNTGIRTGISNISKSSQTQFERNSSINSVTCPHSPHQYTGEASADLAYASMFDSAIAKDLKLMGLI